MQSAAIRAVYALVNGGVALLSWILFPRRLPKRPKTVLVYRIGHLGDTWCAIPSITAIRKKFPESKLILMTNQTDGILPFPKEVLEKIVHFDDVIAYEPSRLNDSQYVHALIARLRENKIDLLVYLGTSIATPIRLLRDMFFFKKAGCKSACGFKVDTLRIFVQTQRWTRRFDQETDRLMKLIRPLKVSEEVIWPVPDVRFEPFERKPNGPVIAVHAFSKHPAKRWPVERFVEVTRVLQARHGATVVLVGGEDGKSEAAELAKSLPGSRDFTGKTSFLETVEILRRSTLLLSNDSGPIHLAASVGTPVVGIYSARDFPNSWYPWGTGHEVLRKDVPCQICYLESCPTQTCIKNVTVEEVIAACERVLSLRKP